MLNPILTVSIFQKKSDPKAFSAGEVIFEEGQPGEVFDVGVLVGVKNRTYTAIAKINSKLVFLDERMRESFFLPFRKHLCLP